MRVGTRYVELMLTMRLRAESKRATLCATLTANAFVPTLVISKSPYWQAQYSSAWDPTQAVTSGITSAARRVTHVCMMVFLLVTDNPSKDRGSERITLNGADICDDSPHLGTVAQRLQQCAPLRDAGRSRRFGIVLKLAQALGAQIRIVELRHQYACGLVRLPAG